MFKTENSNYLDKNGLQITEGARVRWTNPERYESNGVYRVVTCTSWAVELAYLDGIRPNYNMALPTELTVLVREAA